VRHSRIDTQALYALLVLALSGLAMVSVGAARTDIRQPVVRAPTPPEFELSVNAAGTELRFQGRVDFGLTAAMRDIMRQHPGIRRMTLDSHGGYIAEARGVVTVLSAHRIATHVEGHCASACALIFAGGAARSMGPEARIGLHGYALRQNRRYGMIDPQAEMQRDLAIYRAQSIDEGFVTRLAALPQQPMWYPEREELRAAGFLTLP
jgi:hypothetical protein